MAREITTENDFKDKLVKLIPTEIVGAYMVLAGMLGFGAEKLPDDRMAHLLIKIVFVILLVLTPLYLWRVSGVKRALQLVVSTISFAVWVYTLGGPFRSWDIYYPMIASVALVIWSLIPPILITPKPDR